jgi:hypothetical protein
MSCKESPRTRGAVLAIGSAVQKLEKHARVASVILVFAAFGCDSQADARGEARVLVRQLSEFSDDRSLVERSNALGALAKLPLRSADHAQARDVCVAAHRGMLDAETSQASARKALQEAQSQAANGGLDKARATSIANAIEASNRALTQAKQRFPECERAMRKLLTEAH